LLRQDFVPPCNDNTSVLLLFVIAKIGKTVANFTKDVISAPDKRHSGMTLKSMFFVIAKPEGLWQSSLF
jgi:hypothetical protein